jgi:Protein of unknown function (DUF3134)
MTLCYNPSLSEEPRNRPMTVVPLTPRESLLGWLESSGRFRASEMDEDAAQNPKISETLEDILEPEVYASDNEEDQLN